MTSIRLRTPGDDEDDEDTLLPKALEVPELSDEEEDVALPSSALQYLRRVRREQEAQDEVVTADMAKLRLRTAPEGQPNQSPFQDESAAAAGVRLSRQWQQSVEADFSDLRCGLCRWKARNAAALRQAASRLPPAEDPSAWNNTLGSGGGQDRRPDLPTVAACSQRHIHALLEYARQWAERTGLGPQHGCWLFALLAALEKPVPADVSSCLRQVARICRRRRQQLAADDPLVAECSLLICLVGRYFGQADLADPW